MSATPPGCGTFPIDDVDAVVPGSVVGWADQSDDETGTVVEPCDEPERVELSIVTDDDGPAVFVKWYNGTRLAVPLRDLVGLVP